jgi:hypothetical protein
MHSLNLFAALSLATIGILTPGIDLSDYARYGLVLSLAALVGATLVLAIKLLSNLARWAWPFFRKALVFMAPKILWNIFETMFKILVWPKIWPFIWGGATMIWYLLSGMLVQPVN